MLGLLQEVRRRETDPCHSSFLTGESQAVMGKHWETLLHLYTYECIRQMLNNLNLSSCWKEMNLLITILLICLITPNVSAGKTIKQISVLNSEPAGAFLGVFYF